ncbi:glucosaminidase domain-containing protein [Paenibacillus glycanilyticus]|uniref:glucosaminidase domain-containing protein n=1 Tax=Paenibacillus glycanilyticus TaxID=126569 RepID=UPI002040AFFE|nr:glucosaminidase domain-containing protein [Paenibacillus glycanilyticus]MCM3626894.1 glucosaminidase domain-containing protein [Paenibacillus glycanilyticus]
MTQKLNRQDFFAFLSDTVVKVWKEGSPLLPSVRMAQNWLETGGKIHEWNNLGGYKVGSGIPNAFWKGRTVCTSTWEVYNGTRVTQKADWRAYDSVYDFYKDQDLLFTKSRYDRVRAAKTPEAQCAALHACGYATDPDYAAKLLSIIKSNNLTSFDLIQIVDAQEERADEDMETISVYVNGQKLDDGYYDDKKGITYVPVRALAEALGAKVKWNGEEKRVDLTKK